MLEFKIPEITDKKWIDPILKNSGCIGADCTFGTFYIWQKAYNIKICKYKDFLMKRLGDTEIFYSFPVGQGDIRDAFDAIIEDSRIKNIPFKLMGITESMVKKTEELMPGIFEFQEKMDISDYIYNSTDLAFLKGKKYHSKRNHISKFERNYMWEYETISNSNLELCEEFCDKWFEENKTLKLDSINLEKQALKRSFEQYNPLNFLGGIIKSNNKIIAMTIGEEINQDTFLVHFEKALTEYSGAYALINKEFALRNLTKYKYINREEDMGIEGLRKAKLSYYPVVILKKFIAIKRD